MGLAINDKKIDTELEKVVKRLQRDYNIKHVSKTDAVRYLLGIKNQLGYYSERYQNNDRGELLCCQKNSGLDLL